MKYFQFVVWSISYYCLHELTRSETHGASYFNAVILTEIKFISCDNTTPKLNHLEGNICTCEYFIKTKIVDQQIKTKIKFILFLPQ